MQIVLHAYYDSTGAERLLVCDTLTTYRHTYPPDSSDRLRLEGLAWEPWMPEGGYFRRWDGYAFKSDMQAVWAFYESKRQP